MKPHFTPLNASYVRELVKKYNLTPGLFDCERGSFYDDIPTHSVVSYGINSYTANSCPLVIFYDDNSVQLFEDPYIAKNYDRLMELYNYYMEPDSYHYVSSVERFEKYLLEGIKNQTETYNRMVDLNNALQRT